MIEGIIAILIMISFLIIVINKIISERRMSKLLNESYYPFMKIEIKSDDCISDTNEERELFISQTNEIIARINDEFSRRKLDDLKNK